MEENKNDDFMKQLDAYIKCDFDDKVLQKIVRLSGTSDDALAVTSLEEVLDNRSGDFNWLLEIVKLVLMVFGLHFFLMLLLYYVTPTSLYNELRSAESVIEFILIILRFLHRQCTKNLSDTEEDSNATMQAEAREAKKLHLKTIRNCWQNVLKDYLKEVSNNSQIEKDIDGKEKGEGKGEGYEDSDCQLCQEEREKRRKLHDAFDRFTPHDYEFIWFNAWLYSGSDNLWAGLIQQLHHAVEKHYGRAYTYAARLAQLHLTVLKVLFTLCIFGGGIAIIVSLQEEITSFRNQVLAIIGAVLTTFVGLGSTFFYIYSFVVDSSKKSSRMAAQAESTKIKTKLGYMADVKKELLKIGEFLDHPERLPTYWDFMLSDHIKGLFPGLLKLLKWLSSNSVGGRRLPCRFVIFVDDLDRCPPDKCGKYMTLIKSNLIQDINICSIRSILNIVV